MKVTDPVRRWTRQLGELRALVVKNGRSAASEEFVEHALAACDGLLRDLAGAYLECDTLRARVRDGAAAWDHLFDVMPVACILTDTDATILDANHPAGVLLNVTAKRLKERKLVVFSEDRAAFEALRRQLTAAVDGEVRTTMPFRPRDRKPADLDVIVVPLAEEHPARWLWFLAPATPSQNAIGTQLVPAVDAGPPIESADPM